MINESQILELIKEYEVERKIHLEEIPDEFMQEDAPENTKNRYEYGCRRYLFKSYSRFKIFNKFKLN